MLEDIFFGFLQSARNYVISNLPAILKTLLMLLIGYLLIRLLRGRFDSFFKILRLNPTLDVFFKKIVPVILWAILALFIASNFGIDTTAFIASLGVAGFIIGFATHDVLSNIAAGIMILLYKPYHVNEVIEVAGIKGRVEEISMSTSVIISEDKIYVTIPNSKVWGGPIKNFSRLKKH